MLVKADPGVTNPSLALLPKLFVRYALMEPLYLGPQFDEVDASPVAVAPLQLLPCPAVQP